MAMKVVFLIDKLNRGGAERQLIELVKGLDKNRFEITVVIFHDGGDLRQELDEIDGITVVSLNRKGRWGILPFMLRLWQTIRRINPYVVHSYMGGTNELCLFLGRLLGARVVWAIRSSNLDFSCYDRVTRYSFQVAKWLSRFVDLIIVNSQAGRKYHIEKGYSGKRMKVIQNGIMLVLETLNVLIRKELFSYTCFPCSATPHDHTYLPFFAFYRKLTLKPFCHSILCKGE